MRPAHTPYAFSDASIHQLDPRHILAKMVQTRLQCRPGGLIQGDYKELNTIGASLGFNQQQTLQITELARSIPTDQPILEHLSPDLLKIKLLSDPSDQDENKKRARIEIQALVGLCVWAASITLAMLLLK